MNNIKLIRLEDSDREQFILDNQEAFNYGELEEFGLRDDHFEEDEQIISRETIEKSIDGGEAYRIMLDGRPVGGVVIRVEGEKGDLSILFTSPKEHSKGVGYAAWCEVEKLHPEVKVWETVTPYFEQRNIHFYVNRCGFHIVEFYNKFHPDPNDPKGEHMDPDDQFPDGMFRFEKVIKGRQKMKVAITYENGEVFQHFGRTPQFKIFEIEDEKVKSSQVIETGGTGHGALAGFLRERGVEVMICGGIGGGAIMAMAESGIKVYAGASGNADEVIKSYIDGSLAEIGDATCDHHEHEGHDEHGCGHGECHH